MVLDYENTPNKQQTRFLIFDVILYNRQSFAKRPEEDRMDKIKRLSNDFNREIKDTKFRVPFLIYQKAFFKDYQKMQAILSMGKIPHKYDGIIFQPEENVSIKY